MYRAQEGWLDQKANREKMDCKESRDRKENLDTLVHRCDTHKPNLSQLLFV